MRLFSDSSIKQEYVFMRNFLTMGQANAKNIGNTYVQYLTNFTFSVTGYQSNPSTTVLFQLRAYQDQLYNTSNVIIPLKVFNQETLNSYYN